MPKLNINLWLGKLIRLMLVTLLGSSIFFGIQLLEADTANEKLRTDVRSLSSTWGELRSHPRTEVRSLPAWNKHAQKEFEQMLVRSMQLQGKWFVNNQTEKGDFVYQRDVATGKKMGGYNIVRQAGSLYSLAQLYKYTADPEVLETLENGFEFFERLAVPQDTLPPSRAIVYVKNEGFEEIEVRIKKSNASALLLLALIEHIETLETQVSEIEVANMQKNHKIERYKALAVDLANYLVFTQTDEGGFIYRYDPVNESAYNNGESFYALIRMHKLTGDTKHLAAAQKAGKHFIRLYGNAEVDLSFYSWGMEGYAYLYKTTGNEQYWEFMKSYTEEFLRVYAPAKEAFFTNKMPLANNTVPRGSLGVFLEGLAHVAWIAKEKDTAYYSKVKAFIEPSLSHLLTLQIDGPTSTRTTQHLEVSGGTCYDYECTFQRIDIVHHVLSANYLYLTFVL